MIKNESNADRVIRVVIAIAAIAGAFAVGASSVLGIVLFVVAAIMLVTAAVGFCPLYRLFGLSTNKTKATV
jgi:fatty acid desaturase